MRLTLQVLTLLALTAVAVLAAAAARHNYVLVKKARSEPPFALNVGLTAASAADLCPRRWPTTAADARQARLYMQYALDKSIQWYLAGEVVLVIGGSLVGASVLTALGNGTWVFCAGLLTVVAGLVLRARGQGYWRAVAAYYQAQTTTP